jgi:Domain of unknown function (DUF3332)
MRKSIKAATLAGLLLFGSLTTSCTGPFNLTGNLHNWNTSIENKWGEEGMFLVLAILPVYAICILGDAIIFNSIEFWGGENPITPTAMAPTGEMDQVAAVLGLPYEVIAIPVGR